MGTNVDPVCGDDKSYLEKIAGGGVTPRYLGTYQTLAALKADWPDSMGASMNGSWAVASGTQYTYGGAGVGWVMGGGIPHFSGGFLTLPSVASDGDLATIPQLIGSESIRMRYVAASGRWVVETGQSVINAYNQFEVVSAPSTAGIIYAFPWVTGLFQPGQTWRVDMMASAVIGAVGGGFRATFGGTGANSAKTLLSSAIPRGRSNKSFSIKPDGNLDFFEWDSVNYTPTFDAPMYEGGIPRVSFEPGQAGDSFMLRTYILRRLA